MATISHIPLVLRSSGTNSNDLNYFFTHLLCLKVNRNIVQPPLVFLNYLFIHLLCLKLISDKFQGAWLFFNGLFTHLLGLKMIWSLFYPAWYSSIQINILFDFKPLRSIGIPIEKMSKGNFPYYSLLPSYIFWPPGICFSMCSKTGHFHW